MSLRCTQSTLSNFATIYQIYKLYPGQDGVRRGGRRVCCSTLGKLRCEKETLIVTSMHPAGLPEIVKVILPGSITYLKTHVMSHALHHTLRFRSIICHIETTIHNIAVELNKR